MLIPIKILIPTGGLSRNDGSPVKYKLQPGTSACNPASVVICSTHEADLFQCLRPLLSHVHLLWELILTAEPLVVMASVPDICSNTVNALIK